jgi:hypothetical protein
MIPWFQRTEVNECGSRNAECGKYDNLTFSHFLFRIPNSEFQGACHLPAGAP